MGPVCIALGLVLPLWYDAPSTQTTPILRAILSCCVYPGCTIGPIPYGIAASVGAANLRVKTISLGRNTYYFLSIVNVIVSPYLLNPQEANLKGKAAFPAAALTLMLLTWTWFRLPELKGLTAETIDHLFAGRVPTRKFPAESKNYQ